MLRRIPAVKWAFTRLRPVPDSGSIDVTPFAADVSPATAEDVAEAASAQVAEISTTSGRDDAGSAGAAPTADDDTAISVVAESPPAAPTDAGSSEASSRQKPSDVEPVVEEETSVSTVELENAAADVSEPVISNDPAVEISTKVEAADAEPVAVEIVSEPVDAAELVVSSDPLPAPPTDADPVVAEETSPSSVDVEIAPVDAPALVVSDDRSSDVIVDVEPTVEAPCVTSADAEVLAEPASENHFDSDLLPDDALAIEPAAADIAAPVAAVVAEQGSTDAASVITDIAPAPALVSPAPEVRSPPKVRARATEPADRTALIRQRWAETGIRMWNPRLHGTGEATLNIQGSVGLLPPAPGETMPRYDKLEFRMLGGQIVCEGVIVEAPAQASHRSFTRLAEPGKPERVREPARERQAALA
ncbi:hypothetical protein XH99_20650 [Bradyrhizobium nanningense]|uniref:Uncharacterized protein n=1 Tax=Bradyrhizobium nanningense TaxID=1325118 RepID=A0A4Q0S0V6_9BRAD|nr:hypothetical protein [Bradyrhizobium nanningense]RXH26347.1 hypothetical protein XH99_20650 [Bradyrhizobium nanningense]RXH29581.1 hypothetical protein XH84_21460 [Bradyrhizobium nanningense]